MATPKKDQPGVAGGVAGGKTVSEPWSLADQAPNLLAALAEQIADTTHAMQNSIDQLMVQDRIGRTEHRALTLPLDRVKRTGQLLQQIHRFNSGRIRQSHEKTDLAELVENALQERRKEFALLGVEMRRKLKPVDVLFDPTVAFAFVNALIDWALPFGRRVDVRLDLNTWPPHARLQVKASSDGAPPSSGKSLDNIAWMLVRQIAASAGGIDIQREETADGVNVTAMFHRTVQAVDGISAVDLSDDQSSMFKSLQGIYALVVSPMLQVRADVRDALREIGVSADSVVDLIQAREAITHRMPNLIVFDGQIKGPEFDQFRHDILREVLEMPFVEISPDDSAFHMSGFGEHAMAKVGRGNIREALGTAVMFELAKSM